MDDPYTDGAYGEEDGYDGAGGAAVAAGAGGDGYGVAYGAEGRYDEDDEDEFDEEDADLLRNIGEQPMMDRVQKRIWDNLQRKRDRIELELREVSEEATRSKKEREDLGVELYGLQQQLAKLQMQLESAHNNAHLIADIRTKAERDLSRFREAYKERKAQLEVEESKLDRAKAELEGINETQRQVEAYDKEMKSEIAVTRRETYAAEEAVTKAEKAKQAQDLYIDRLNENFKNLTEELELYEARINAQKKEAEAATETLLEATREMEAIQAEKKQLLQQWQSSLIGMQKRDEALQATHDALRKQQEAEQAMQAEERGYRKDMQKAQVENAKLQERLDKEESEATFLQTQLQAMKRQRDSLAERYGMLQKSLAQTDKESSRLRLEQESLTARIRQLEQDRQTVERERQVLETGYEQNLSTQTTVQKAAKNLIKEKRKIVEAIHAKEMERASVENELARVKVDAMNVESHNVQLRETLSACVAELKEKDRLIEKYEMEVRQRNDSIEKKIYLVDRLNRKYEKLTAGQTDENMGPLEATIKNLTKQIASTGEASERLQRQWLQDQTQLVDLVNDVESKAEKAHDMESQYTLATQKQMRLDAAISQQQTEITQLRNGIETMHKDMVRLNTMIAENESLSKRLAEAAFSIEKDFVAELKELERESIALEAQIATSKEEVARLMEEILEAERQVMLWEKKIALEKETQAALDPTVGMAEAADMEREIHRMKLRFETLKRDQERLIKEMERAIDKRESIELRFKGRNGGASTAVGPKKKAEPAVVTKAGLKKQVTSLKKALKAATADTRGYEEAIELKQRELQELETAVEEKSQQLGEAESASASLQQSINSVLYDKQRGIERLASLKRTAARYKAIAEGRRPMLSGEEVAGVDDRLQDAMEDQTRVRMVLEGLSEAHPGMADVLHRVSQLLEV